MQLENMAIATPTKTPPEGGATDRRPQHSLCIARLSRYSHGATQATPRLSVQAVSTRKAMPTSKFCGEKFDERVRLWFLSGGCLEYQRGLDK